MLIAIGTPKEAAKQSEQRALEIVAPFLKRDELNELCSGRCFSEYRERRKQFQRARLHHAIAQQKALGRFNAQRETRAIGDGAIRWVMSLVPELEMACRQIYGEQCWQDPDFKKDTYKKTPEVRVPEPKRRAWPVNGFRDLVSSETARGELSDGETRSIHPRADNLQVNQKINP